jgi:hypothetical protein
MIGVNMTYVGTGIIFGNYVQGVTVIASNFTGGYVGIQSNASEAALADLTVSSSQFNCHSNGIVTVKPST